jgi:basic amino acid/polyamine antiporter, APA family
MNLSDPARSQSAPKGKLGLLDAIMVLCGNTIGSGVFLVAGAVALAVPNAASFLAVWVVGGVLVMAGALTFAELASRMPESGGQYVYLRAAFGRRTAFLFGWTSLLVYQTGGLAAVAAGCANFLGRSLLGRDLSHQALTLRGWHLPEANVLAVAIILVLSATQCIGLRLSVWLQNTLETLNMAGILGMIAWGILLTIRGATSRVAWTAPWHPGTPGSFWGVGMITVLWVYDGWDRGTWLAGEIQNPRRNVPLCLIAGTLAVIFLYVGANWTYVEAVSARTLLASDNAAADAVSRVLGSTAERFMDSLIAVSTFACLNAIILAGPRLYSRMADDGLFFNFSGWSRGRTNVLLGSILLQAAWACVLAMSGTYEELIKWVTFCALGLHGLTAAALAVLRRRGSRAEKEVFLTPGWPVTPLVFALTCGWIMINTLRAAPRESLAGAGLVALGLPCYEIWRRRPGAAGSTTALSSKASR